MIQIFSEIKAQTSAAWVYVITGAHLLIFLAKNIHSVLRILGICRQHPSAHLRPQPDPPCFRPHPAAHSIFFEQLSSVRFRVLIPRPILLISLAIAEGLDCLRERPCISDTQGPLLPRCLQQAVDTVRDPDRGAAAAQGGAGGCHPAAQSKADGQRLPTSERA